MSIQEKRAYSTVVFKTVDEDHRIIEGFASTPSLDLDGDELLPAGAEYSLPQPLLLNHSQDRPIGQVLSATVTAKGIRIRAQIAAKGVTPWIDEAWQLIKAGLIRGLSVGAKFKFSDTEKTATGLRVMRWKWLETSAVVIPANQQASILMVKSLDTASLAVSGEQLRSRVLNLPVVSGPMTGKQMEKTVSEQLTAARAEMTEKSARYSELLAQEDNESGLTKDDEAERDTLTKALETLTGKVARLAVLEKTLTQSGTLTVVAPPRHQQTEKPKVQVVNLPKGALFTRVVMAVAAGRGSRSDTLEFAKQFSNTPEVLAYVKAGLYMTKAEEGTSVVQSPGWGGELVNPNTMQTEFVELLMPRTIIGRVQGFDVVPFNIPFIEQTGGSTFNWVGEGAPKPVGELSFERNTVTKSKVAGIVVLTDELIRLSDPKAEEKVRSDMIKQCAKFLDQQFIRVAVSAGASNPASITNGVSAPNATGTTAAALRHDLNIALATFDTANEDEGSDPGLVIVMTPALARGISLLTTSLGIPEFPTMNPQGGTLLGYPVIVSSSVDSGTIVIFKPSDVFLADDGRVTLDASREATLDMSGSTSPTFNLWQNNCVGLRAERWIRWQKKRSSGVVAIIDTAAYAPA